MDRLMKFGLLFLAGLTLLLRFNIAGQGSPKTIYVCPPCACGKDEAEDDQPGTCPVCRMAMVVMGSVQAQPMASSPAERGSRSRAEPKDSC